jgi:chromatin segregation and condensation protein Rec8/ScpA/Scc1 (kleisin family)
MTAEKNGQGEHLNRNIFLNYWNLNQTFFMVGVSTKDKFLHFLDVIKRRNPSLKVNEDSYLTERLSIDETKKELIDVIKRSELFY